MLGRLLRVESTTGQCQRMQKFITEQCSKYRVTQDVHGNIYVEKGHDGTYPCVVAHMDTVHDITTGGLAPIHFGDKVGGWNIEKMEQAGIGGDDKCGVYAAIRCLDALPACKAVFFVDEERGCRGSRACVMDFFDDARFVLQADRRGTDDWVENINGDLGSSEFQDAVRPIRTKYGYKTCMYGMMTDVQALRDRNVGVSVANMSAFYFSPHSSREIIDLSGLEKVTEMMIEICSTLTERYPFVYERPAYTYQNNNHCPKHYQQRPQVGFGSHHGSSHVHNGHSHGSKPFHPADGGGGSVGKPGSSGSPSRESFPDWEPSNQGSEDPVLRAYRNSERADRYHETPIKDDTTLRCDMCSCDKPIGSVHVHAGGYVQCHECMAERYV